MIAVCAYLFTGVVNNKKGGAESGTRTHTPLMALAFEASMSTNSIISAYKWEPKTRIFTEEHSLADCSLMVRKEGLEPSIPCGPQFLRL